MTNQEMIEKLETAKALMADVYGEVCYMDKKYYGRIEDLDRFKVFRIKSRKLVIYQSYLSPPQY
jgi:hypothetical protein